MYTYCTNVTSIITKAPVLLFMMVFHIYSIRSSSAIQPRIMIAEMEAELWADWNIDVNSKLPLPPHQHCQTSN